MFEILSIDPCAEDPHQVQLEGRLLQPVAEGWSEKMQDIGWTVFRIGTHGSVVAKRKKDAMLILRADCGFTLSRIPDRKIGLSLLDEIFVQ